MNTKKPAKKKTKKLTPKQNRKSKMAAPKGNQFWKARAKHGRKKLFSSPDVLWNCCVQYFEWVEANPLKEEKVFHTDGRITRADVGKMRAMTIGGLCIFLDIVITTWENYKAEKGFLDVITRAEQIIRTQKFTGAAADLLNPNIIARDLGLSDKRDHTIEGGVLVAPADITPEQWIQEQQDANTKRTDPGKSGDD